MNMSVPQTRRCVRVPGRTNRGRVSLGAEEVIGDHSYEIDDLPPSIAR